MKLLAGPSILKGLKDVEIVENKPLELTCEVSGTPRPACHWFKDDQPIAENEHVKLTSKDNFFTLTIENSNEKNDKGVYRAEFVNDFGKSESKSNVSIISMFFKLQFIF